MNNTYNSLFDATRDFRGPSTEITYQGRSLDEVEKDILNRCQVHTEAQISGYYDELEAARIRWACITSKTQRRVSDQMQINVFESMTEIKHVYLNTESGNPPSRKDQPIQEFSAKSRYNLLSKMRKMKKSELQLPYFVTLTYQHNQQDFQEAKKQLNVFFQRLRRIDRESYYEKNPATGRMNKKWKALNRFKYCWKMEYQKRGAIHFHLMLFVPEKLFPNKRWACKKSYKDSRAAGYKTNKALEYVRMYVSSVWNEVSNQALNFNPVRSESGRIFGNMALYAGVNVRDTKNWDMATGYLSKYMEKEQQAPRGKKLIDRKQIKQFNGCPGYRVYWKDKVTGQRKAQVKKWSRPETGRFWGFSNNFDFSVYYRNEYDMDKIQQTREYLFELTEASFEAYQVREQKNLKRIDADKSISDKKARYEKARIFERFKKQKRRFLINQMKIEEGCNVQMEIAQEVVREIIPEN